MIEYISGDILKSSDQFIAQGVATGSQEGLGTGLAYKISNKWPEVQKLFKKHTRNRKYKAGDIFIAKNSNGPNIIYIATQPDMYHAELSYLNKGLGNLKKYCLKHQPTSISIPKIGAGLGKLDWETQVKPLLEKHLSGLTTLINVYEDFKNEYESEEDI